MPKWTIFGRPEPQQSCSRAGAVRILQKLLVTDIDTKMMRNSTQNGAQMATWAVQGRIFVILGGFPKDF